MEVLRAVVETLVSTPLDCVDSSCGGGHTVSAKLGALGWSRFLRDHVVNARTTHGQTPLILACEQGCGPTWGAAALSAAGRPGVHGGRVRLVHCGTYGSVPAQHGREHEPG